MIRKTGQMTSATGLTMLFPAPDLIC